MSISERLFSASAPVFSDPSLTAQQAALDAIAREMASLSTGGSPRAPAASQAVLQGHQAAQLDNRGATFPPRFTDDLKNHAADEREGQRGASRWRLKSKIQRLLRQDDGRGPAVCGCGYAGVIWKSRTTCGSDGEEIKTRVVDRELETVRLHRRESGAGVSNVIRCDSPWLCPTCGPGRALRRRERLLEVIEATEARGGSVAFVTLTVRHNLSTRLADAKRLVSEASRTARQGREWVRIRDEGGILGVVQGVEVLHSRATGWHYHAHLIVPGLGSPQAVEKAAREFVDRYLERVVALGGSAQIEGQDVELVWDDDKIARYAGKGSAAWEVAGGLKAARSAVSRTPWDLVTLSAGGDGEAEGLFREYAACMPGTRSCVVSPALATKLGLNADDDADQPDEGAEEQDKEQRFDDRDSFVGELKSSVWRTLMTRGTVWKVLDAVEKAWPWVEIEALAEKLSRPYEIHRPCRDHAPSPWSVAARAQGLVYLVKGGPSAAITAAIEEEARWATKQGMTFKPPRMRAVIEWFNESR